MRGYKKKETIQKYLRKLENTDNDEETNVIWKQICATSEDISLTERRIEANNQKRSKVKIVCYRDLRIRGLLALAKTALNQESWVSFDDIL